MPSVLGASPHLQGGWDGQEKIQYFALWCAKSAPGDCPVALANFRFLQSLGSASASFDLNP